MGKKRKRKEDNELWKERMISSGKIEREGKEGR